MVKKAIDSRIPALIRNGAQEKRRSFFVVVGDRQKDVIVNLYHILLNVDLKLNKSVLWAYKNKLLGFTSHRKKREKKIRKEIKRGIRDADTDDPFELFISTQNIRYVYYKETEKILGNTYGICILQDFEAITPNLLARTIETVEGGGLVLLLLKGMNTLKQLYTLSMDIHSRYRTEAHTDVTARFNERFILSLGSCESCLVVDDELNVLPISGGKSVKPLPAADPTNSKKSANEQELETLVESLADSQPVGSLIKLAKTLDQGKALITFIDAIAEKTLQSTVALTAARGRGKSAALGLAIAAAVAHGYSNIFITSPSPENLKTLFEFVFKGFDALGYLDHHDYSIIQSTNPDFNKAIVRVNVHRQHRQTIQYIQPQDSHVLGQAELVVIDEAAAIPLPLVRKLLGPYLVFLASTINGYEGTGRSLSLKLISQLREQSRGRIKAKNELEAAQIDAGERSATSRSLREVTLSEPIRYAAGDGVEKWLNKVLCLDATLPQKSTLANAAGTPHPSECQLLAVNRDTLFSFHPVSERFLHSMISLYVASHYKNSPNDLQLMSDAPAHQLYVLVPPLAADASRLPEPLVVIQVALEGQISRASVQDALGRGQRPGGDLIPWLVAQQFQDDAFAGLSGARIVRIATNPEYTGMGYGARALQLLLDFYSGNFLSLAEDDSAPPTGPQEMVRVTDEELANSALLQDNIKVRDIAAMPPLFSRLGEIRPPAALDYVGVSYGLTPDLHRFWKRARFAPVYLRQTTNDLTGEHTCVMLRTLGDAAWLPAFADDFHRRFLSLLSFGFRTLECITSLSIEESAHAPSKAEAKGTGQKPLTKAVLDAAFTPHDLRRLESYAANMLDYHVILNLLPAIADMYFAGPLRAAVKLSGVQTALLLGIGLQRKSLEDVGRELGLVGAAQPLAASSKDGTNQGSTAQLMGMFVKLMRKVSSAFRAVLEDAVAADLPAEDVGVEDDEEPVAASDMPSAANGASHPASRKRKFAPLAEPLAAELSAGAAEAAAQINRESSSEDMPQNGHLSLNGLQVDAEEDLDPAEAERKARARSMIDALPLAQYARANGDDDAWFGAEEAVKKGRSSSGVVSVKRKKKDGGEDEGGGKGKKKPGVDAFTLAAREAEKAKIRGKGGHKAKERRR